MEIRIFVLPDIRSSRKIKAAIHGSVLWVKTRTRPGLFKKKKRNLASDPQESFKTVEDLVKLTPSVDLKLGMVFSK